MRQLYIHVKTKRTNNMKPTKSKLIAETANIVRNELVPDNEFCIPNLMCFGVVVAKKKICVDNKRL